MKSHYITNDHGDVSAIISMPDFVDQKVKALGGWWRFDFDKYLGPCWIKKDGEPRKNQNVPRKVWSAFDRWMKTNKLK